MWNLKKYMVSKNFKEAANYINKRHYMCVVLYYEVHYLLLLSILTLKLDIKKVYAKYGFTRENFHNFVKKYYPELTKDLWLTPLCWCDVTDETLKAKKHFLEYLSVNIDNPFIKI